MIRFSFLHAINSRCGHVWLVCNLFACIAACRSGETNPPRHYKDPQQMIAEFESPERDAWAQPEQVIRSLRIEQKDAVIADVGAGSGYFTRRLALEVPEGKVYAVEVDDEFRRYIAEKREQEWGTPNIEPHLAFYDDFALPDNTLDLVFVSNTYAFLRDRIRYFQKVRAALKPTGRLAIISFRPEAQVPGKIAPEPKYRVAKEITLQELKQAGFELEREETFLPYQYFLILKPVP